MQKDIEKNKAHISIIDYENIFKNITYNEKPYFVMSLLKNNNQRSAYFFNLLNDDQKILVMRSLAESAIETNISLGILNLPEASKNVIAENIYHFATIGCNIYELKEKFKNNDEALAELNRFVSENPNRLRDIFRNVYDEESLSEYWDFIYLTLIDVMTNENATFQDLKWIAEGRYSSIMNINSKIIKFGFTRGTKTFPNNPYIVKPLLRKSYSDNEKNIFIEVTELVETANPNKTEVYKIYRALRKMGLIWTDVELRNIGKLIKDNDIYWNEELNPTDESLTLEAFIDDGTRLKKGALVILDADHIYKENDPDILIPLKNELYQELESKYQKELKKGR